MQPIITVQNIKQAAEAILLQKPDFKPQIGIILGSGMSEMGEHIQDATVIPYGDVPFMVPSTVQGHKGRFILGRLEEREVICMQGRLHAYEGNSAQQIAFPVYVMKELGVSILVVTNAAGGIDATYGVGDLMLIEDHINFQSINPVIGPVPQVGPRFFDMTQAYSPRLISLAQDAAQNCDINVHKGVYIAVLGPSFETPAEIRAFRALGADAVGMSTVQEVIAANQLGLEVLGISLISNPAAGVLDRPLDINDVALAAQIAATNMEQMILAFLKAL